MADVNGRLPSGFDEDFVTAIEEDFRCIICQLPSREPVLTRCGHRFCRECLEEYLRRQEQEGQLNTCPVDREALHRDRDVFPDRATERKILSLAIKCPNEGCEWTDDLRAKEVHLASCIFKFISCTNENCDVRVAKKDLEEHVTIRCLWRTVECDYCHELHQKCQMEEHYEKCKRYPMTCPGGCMALTSREMIENHTENYCPKTVIPCPYAQMGCKMKVQREKLESHIQSDTGPHIKLVCLGLTKTQEELAKRTRELSSLEERVNVLQKEQEGRVKALEEEANLLRKQVEERNNNLQQLHTAHEKKFSAFENEQGDRVKTIKKEVNLLSKQLEEETDNLKQQCVTHAVKFDSFQNEQDERIRTLEEGMNVSQNEQDEKVKNLQEELHILQRGLERAHDNHEELTRRGRWDTYWRALIFFNVCAVVAILVLK